MRNTPCLNYHGDLLVEEVTFDEQGFFHGLRGRLIAQSQLHLDRLAGLAGREVEAGRVDSETIFGGAFKRLKLN